MDRNIIIENGRIRWGTRRRKISSIALAIGSQIMTHLPKSQLFLWAHPWGLEWGPSVGISNREVHFIWDKGFMT
jgi:hypothetical protein